MFDIAVIGLGPAGANFARLIDTNKYSVAAIDKKDINGQGGFKKPCGGLLAPDAQKALASLNLPLPGDVLVSPQIFYVRTIDLDNRIEKNYQRFYLNIDRHKFDKWLISLIPKSVTVYSGTTVTGISRKQEHFEIYMRSNGETKVIEARNVVGADGANSIVSKCFLDKNERNLKLSIQEWYKKDGSVPFFSCVFDGENSGSYSWSLYKDDYLLLGGAYEPKKAKKVFERQRDKLREFGIETGEPVKREACFVRRLKTPLDFCLGKDGVYMTGEAAGFISPSSFEGISGALVSSHILSRIFNESKSGIAKRYKRATVKLRLKYSLKIIKANILNSRLIRLLIMKSRFKSIKVER